MQPNGSYDEVARDYEELKKEGRQAKREDQEKLELLQLLVRHPGWKIVTGFLTNKKQELGDEILREANSVDEMVRCEGKKGEMRGILYLEACVASTIAGLQLQFGEDRENEQ